MPCIIFLFRKKSDGLALGGHKMVPSFIIVPEKMKHSVKLQTCEIIVFDLWVARLVNVGFGWGTAFI
jgi:hypothetical protein